MARPKKKQKTVQVTVRLPEEWDEILEKKAAFESTSKAAEVKKAVLDFLIRNGYLNPERDQSSETSLNAVIEGALSEPKVALVAEESIPYGREKEIAEEAKELVEKADKSVKLKRANPKKAQ